MFGRHTSTATEPGDTVVDERADDVVAEPTKATDEAVAGEPTTETVDEQVTGDRTRRISTGSTTVVEPATVVEPVPVVEKTGWAHVSIIAALSLIVGTLSVTATLTGLLAPLGFATGVLAVLLGIVGTLAVRRPSVTGHGLIIFGMIFGAVAIVLSVLAMNGQLSWLSSKTDEIATVHNWLNNHMHWLRRF
jgi:hypothetical protein